MAESATRVLPQPVHRPRGRQVLADLGHGAGLRGGRGEGQRAVKPLQQLPTATVSLAGARAGEFATARHQHLQLKELAQNQVSPRALPLGLIFGKMNRAGREPAWQRVQSRGQELRQIA